MDESRVDTLVSRDVINYVSSFLLKFSLVELLRSAFCKTAEVLELSCRVTFAVVSEAEVLQE